MRKNLTRQERLKKSKELSRLFQIAKRVKCSELKLLYLENHRSVNRIAVCTAKGFRKAVARNREKRICREAYRLLKNEIKPGYDLVVVIYPGAYMFIERFQQLQELLKRAGLVK